MDMIRLFVKVRECCFHKTIHFGRQNEAEDSQEKSEVSISFQIYGCKWISLVVCIMCVHSTIKYQAL
jgi:uncharacterized Fe-S cluster-containing MiaB family protein